MARSRQVCQPLRLASHALERPRSAVRASVLNRSSPHGLALSARRQGWRESPGARQGLRAQPACDLTGRLPKIAVPIRTRGGDVIGAISVSLPIGNETGQQAVARALPLLREAEHALQSLL